MKKTLYKSRKDRFLFGVCGGLAEYFEVDPTLLRILTAASVSYTHLTLPTKA